MTTKSFGTYSLVFGHQSLDDQNLAEIARHAVAALFKLCTPINGHCRSEGRFKLDRALRDAGFTKNIGALGLFLYELGVMKRLSKHGGGTQFRFFFIDPEYFFMIVTDETIEMAAAAVLARGRAKAELFYLKKKVKKPVQRAAPTVVAEVDPALLEALAEAAVVAEQLRAQIATMQMEADKNQQQIVQLQSQTQAQPQAIAAALMAKIRGNS